MVIKPGDTIVTEKGLVGIVTLANNYSAGTRLTEAHQNSGSVLSVKMAHDPSDTKIYIVERENYNFSLNEDDCIKTIARGKKVILDFLPR